LSVLILPSGPGAIPCFLNSFYSSTERELKSIAFDFSSLMIPLLFSALI